jgi:hypothetical protein
MDPILPPVELDPPDPEPRPRATRPIVCEMCECRLAPSGEAISLSEKYKAMRDREDSLASLTRERDAARGERDAATADVARLTREIETLRNPPAPAKQKFKLTRGI